MSLLPVVSAGKADAVLQQSYYVQCGQHVAFCYDGVIEVYCLSDCWQQIDFVEGLEDGVGPYLNVSKGLVILLLSSV